MNQENRKYPWQGAFFFSSIQFQYYNLTNPGKTPPLTPSHCLQPLLAVLPLYYSLTLSVEFKYRCL